MGSAPDPCLAVHPCSQSRCKICLKQSHSRRRLMTARNKSERMLRKYVAELLERITVASLKPCTTISLMHASLMFALEAKISEAKAPWLTWSLVSSSLDSTSCFCCFFLGIICIDRYFAVGCLGDA